MATTDLLWSAVSHEDEVGVVGIHGSAGVGKSRLLRLLVKKLQQHAEGDQAQDGEARSFEVVVTVTASEGSTEQSVLATMARQLGVTAASGGSDDLPSHTAASVSAALEHKSFLVVLDGLWEPVSLDSVGIPDPASGPPGRRKLVVASRIKHVLTQMGASKVLRMDALSAAASWEVFVLAAGKDLDTNQGLRAVRKAAEKLVNKLGGNPLALQSVGRAMSSTRSLAVWEQASRDVDTEPWKVPGMKPLLESLKRTYDNLRFPDAGDDDRRTRLLQSCFGYITLYGRGYGARLPALIDQWVGEGLIDGFETMDQAVAVGERVVETLEGACLVSRGNFDTLEKLALEQDSSYWEWEGVYKDMEEDAVKINDHAYAMATWVRKLNGKLWVVKPAEKLTAPPPAEEWEAAERVSLMLNNIAELPSGELHCPELASVMLWHNTELSEIPDGFLRDMPNLKMLQLGCTITALPPSIGDLQGLLHLDLQSTGLDSLPRELGNLSKLRFLNLEKTPCLRSIPKGVFSKLQELVVLRMQESGYGWAPSGDDDNACVDELTTLRKLKQVDINLSDVESLRALFRSPHTKDAVRGVSLESLSVDTLDLASDMENAAAGPTSVQIANSSDELEQLWLGAGSGPNPEGRTYLRRLKYLSLEGLKLVKITWMGVGPLDGLVNLRELKINSCFAVEELVNGPWDDIGSGDPWDGEGWDPESGERPPVLFPYLEVLELTLLPSMESICKGGKIQFPSLKRLEVLACPKLTDLAFGEASALRLEKILGGQDWWDALEWRDNSIKTRLEPLLQVSDDFTDMIPMAEKYLEMAKERKAEKEYDE